MLPDIIKKEEFVVSQKDNKFFVRLEGQRFKNKAEIIVSANHLVYEEKNTEYNYNAFDENNLMIFLKHMIQKWIDCNTHDAKDNFENYLV